MQFSKQLGTSVASGQYEKARLQIKNARKEKIYNEADRLVFFLDLGAVEHYAGAYAQSNKYLDRAEQTIEELFTHRVSQIALSYLMNDNVTDYWGEAYESIYIHIFKALNYHFLNDPDAALVEVRKVNVKLQEMEDRYSSFLGDITSEKDLTVDLEVPFYSDGLAHYLSALFYQAQGADDDSRISLEKLKEAWHTQKQIYESDFPDQKNFLPGAGNNLCLIAFTGAAPRKIEAGGMITTYEDFIGISDLSTPVALPNIPFPGSKPGYHFKFAFPVIDIVPSKIEALEVRIDGDHVGDLTLLEDMGRIADYTFENHKMFIYIKTLIRTVTKGLAAAEAKKKLKKEAEADDILGAFIDFAVDASVDATERADLRNWKTMPQNCYVGNFKLAHGAHLVELNYLNGNGQMIKSENRKVNVASNKINLLEFVTLQ